MRTQLLHRIALLGLVFSGPALFAPVDAYAQDDNRRVLRARHMEETDVSEEYARMAEAKRLESIRFLRELLAEGSAEGDRKAEMMLRLADMYFQQGRAIFLREMKAFDIEFDRCFNTEGCDTALLKANNVESRDWQEKSIRLYEHILTQYPRYNRADEATFYLGSALSDLGRRDQGVEYFGKLVKLYPDSGFVPDAYVQIGEYYFDNDNAYKALLAYKKATAYPDHEKYGFALYKLAWTYYNVGEYGNAITTMKSVVTYSTATSDGQQGSRFQLGEEALKDLVRFFADAGELDEAYEYFTKLGKKDLIHAMLRRLASTYTEQGKWEEAVQTYRRLIAEDPQAAKNPSYQHEIVQAYRKMGNSEATFSEIDRMIKTYGSNTAWARANASDRQALDDAKQQIERDLLQVATEHHDRGRKLHGAAQVASFDLASRAYGVYLEEFPTSESSYEVHYQYAELLYRTKQFAKAYDHYVAVVNADPNGKHSKFCAESAIFAAEEMIKQEQAANPQPKSSSIEAIPLTSWEERLVESCDRYAKLYAGDAKVRNIIYKSAYMLYHKHQLERAAERFRTVIEMDPTSSEAEQAAHLILDSFVIREDWANLSRNAKFFYEQERLGSKKFKREVYEIYQNASLKLIEVDYAATKDHGKAADAYVGFYEAFPESTELPRVLNNAALYYREAGRVGDSMKVRRILVEDPKFGPATRYYYTQVGALGYDYETIADFNQAAFYYEKLFSLYPKERESQRRGGATEETLASLDQAASDAIYSAAVFRRALGDWKTAIANYKSLVATFPSDARVDDINIGIGTIYAEQGDPVQAGTVFFNFYSKATPTTDANLVYYARLHGGKALEAQGQGARAKRLYDETIAMYKKFIAGGGQPGPYTDYVAQMLFEQAETTYETFKGRQITGCKCTSRQREDKVLGDNLTAKAKGLIEVEKVYKEIIATGSGKWGLAALTRLGMAYEEMGRALKESDVPFYLTDDQREIYLMRLEDKVYPQTQKAISVYREAMEKSWELTLYDDATAFATRRLGVLAPDEFPGLEETVPVPALPSRTTRNYAFETEL